MLLLPVPAGLRWRQAPLHVERQQRPGCPSTGPYAQPRHLVDDNQKRKKSYGLYSALDQIFPELSLMSGP
jgi:hypothetical protein